MSTDQASAIQNQMYHFIVNYIRREGQSPTNDEIGRELQIVSTGHVDYHLTMLEKKGLISRQSRKTRGIKLVRPVFGIPLYGAIAAGEPLAIFEEQDQVVDVGREYERDNNYALLVQGNSMVEDHICDGDYVVIKPQDTCANGDIVVAVRLTRGQGSATLKRFFQEKDHNRIRLQPANSEFEPIFVSKSEWDAEWKVQGKVVAIFRKLGYLHQGESQREKEPLNTNFADVHERSDEKFSLFAVARTNLEEDNKAFVGKTYTVQAGVSQSTLENFQGEMFNVSLKSAATPISFDILLHASENVKFVGEWHKHLAYVVSNKEPQLVEFLFQVTAPGSNFIVVDFYRELCWVKTIRREFDVIEKSLQIAESLEV